MEEQEKKMHEHLEDNVFIPKYTIKAKAVIILLPLLTLMGSIYIKSSLTLLEYIFFASLSIFALTISSLLLYKEIRFTNRIEIVKYIYKTKYKEYFDIKCITSRFIYFSNGTIPFQMWINSDELLKIINAKMQDGKVSETQFEYKYAKNEFAASFAGLISIIVSGFLHFIMVYLNIELIRDRHLQIFLLLSIIYFPVYFIIKNRLKVIP